MTDDADTSSSNTPKKISLIVFVLACVTFLLSVISDRITPNTDQARVKGLTLSIAPLVSGHIHQVDVGMHSKVEKGDVLFVIDLEPYKLAVDAAKATLEKTSQSLEAGSSSISSAVARLSKAQVKLQTATKNWERTQRIFKISRGALSTADKDKSESAYLEAKESVTSAEANLAKQKAALGPTGDNNPDLKKAISQLKQAQWNLAHTVITAPTSGIIESFNVEEGYFAAAGRPLVSLVSNDTLWIQANMKENNLSNMQAGNEVELIFDIMPGRVYTGKVSSISYGVATGKTKAGELPTVRTAQGWLRDPQRFPVIIQLDEGQLIEQYLRQGSQVSVVVYTGNNWVMNLLAALKIRALSVLSYAR